MVVCPGLIDLSARLREPGFEYKATLESEMQAAIAGGVTSLACPPDTDPPLDEPGVVVLGLVDARAHRIHLEPVVRRDRLGCFVGRCEQRSSARVRPRTHHPRDPSRRRAVVGERGVQLGVGHGVQQLNHRAPAPLDSWQAEEPQTADTTIRKDVEPDVRCGCAGGQFSFEDVQVIGLQRRLLEQRFPDAGAMQAEWRRLMRSAEANAQLEQARVPNGEPATTRLPWWRRVIGR